MDDPYFSETPQKKTNSVIDILLIASGVTFMAMAICLLSFLFLRNSVTQTVNSDPAAEAGPFVYNGQQIYHVAAGAKQISALSYSSQAPVIVMFDADW